MIADALDRGEQVKLTWYPGRVVVIEYQGNGFFIVVLCGVSAVFR